MVNRAFRYDLNSDAWIECTDENFINADIEKIPTVLVLNYFDLPYSVYCPVHHFIEKIVEENDSEIISAEGCKFQDSDRVMDKKLLYCPTKKYLEEVILADGNEIITDTFSKFTGLVGFGKYTDERIPFRWRIFQSSVKAPINIAVDFAEIKRDNSGIRSRWENFFIAVSFAKKISAIKRIKTYHLYRIRSVDWTEAKTEIEIPEIVENAAMEIFLEDTKAIYGFKPTVITKFRGKEKILAYIKRPFDPDILLLKEFFVHFGDFDRIFPYDCTDNYKIICRLLEINPPKSLRKAYAENHYAIIWYMLFRQWGVKDINFMQKFFRIDDSIAIFPLDEFIFHAPTKQVVKSGRSVYWGAFNHFCKFILKNKGEKFFMNRLYKISTTKNLTQDQIDTMSMFHNHEEHISAEIKTRLLKDGLTRYIHDAMSSEVGDYLQRRDNVKIFYDEKVLSCEGNTDGYEFTVVKDTNSLYHVGLELANCVMTYRHQVLNLDSIIFVAAKENKLVACIEVRDGEIVQALGCHNQILTGEIASAVEKWSLTKDIHALKYATAEIPQQKKSSSVQYKKSVRGDMITQAEIDALLGGY